MRRSCASALLAWLWASSVQAAPAEEPSLPGLADETLESPAAPEEPAPEPSEPPAAPPSEPVEDIAPAPVEQPVPSPSTDPFTTGEPAEPPTSPPPAPPTTPSVEAPATTSAEPKAAASSDEEHEQADEHAKNEGDDEKDEKKKGDDEKTEKKDEEKAEPIKHKGFIIDFRVGVQGCTRRICKNHDAKPGVRLDGMLGRNFFGFIDIGMAGAWGRMRTNVAPGTSGLSLYGLDPAALPPEAAALMFDQFTVNDARFETIQAGLDVRVHVIPRGRFDPYVGVGAQYNLLRALYDTPAGSTRLGFHGLAFPIQAGFVYFVHKNIAVGAQFDWLITWYGGITVRGAPGRLGAPIPLIKDAAAEAGVNLPGDLPHFWNLGAVVHFRFGK